LVCGYVPHSLVFSRAAAIIQHGGMGTSGQALRAGKPQLVVPFFGDQPDNGGRLSRLGVARVLARKRYNAERAAAELAVLRRDPAYAERAAECAKIVAQEDGAQTVADVIEGLLQRR
jgi:UDP:flavonoid glycosyltransferase YjiC (YdhE family)